MGKKKNCEVGCQPISFPDITTISTAGYDAVVGQRGTMLSAGERQRLSIARALVSNPSVLLLDEATAFLDSNTEADVQEAIYDSTRGRTCLVIAHRLSTVVNADQIIVLAHGRIVAQGSHHQLYSECPLYRSYFDKQFRKAVVEEPGTRSFDSDVMKTAVDAIR